MANPQQDPCMPTQPLPQEGNNSCLRWPRQPKDAGADEGVKCTTMCLYLPSLSKKKPVKRAPSKSAEGSGAPAHRVTFLASASLSTWWASSPSDSASAAASGNAAAKASAQGRRAAPSESSSFPHWRRSQGSRVTPHGAAASASFSFPSSPASTSSCLSTPKLAQGCQEDNVFGGLLEARQA